MKVVPLSIVGQTMAFIWLALCMAVAVMAWVQRDVNDMPEALFWLMVFLSPPLGFPAGVGAGMLTSFLSDTLGISHMPFWSEMPMWGAMVVVGYVQWFIVLPGIWRGIRSTISNS